MDFVAVALAALAASALTMFSGFGLGTLLMPVFALFFPLDLAVAATAVVHGANSLVKGAVLGKLADREVVVRFGVPAVVAALLGAWLLVSLSGVQPLHVYDLAGKQAVITPLKLLVALLMAGFAVLELHPRFEALHFARSYLPLGGLLSGFFGGLSGHQGALRSAFLSKVGISAEAFVGTNAVIGLMVDLTRLSAYAVLASGGMLAMLSRPREAWLIGVGVVAAFLGVFLGKRVLKKVTMRMVQRVTGSLLVVIALLLAAGVV